MQKIGNQIRIPIYLSEPLLTELDNKRGLVPRATYIRSILSESLGIPTTTDTSSNQPIKEGI